MFSTGPFRYFRYLLYFLKTNSGLQKIYTEIDEFCFKNRDGISEIRETKNILNKQNLSKVEFTALQALMQNKNQNFIINKSDKNLGAAAAEKKDVITVQLYDIYTCIKLSMEEAEMVIAKIEWNFLKW